MATGQQKAHLIIKGRVQGVSFRVYTYNKAKELQLGGWVRNTSDGAVEIEASGTIDKIEQLILWCHAGSPSSKVEEVLVEWKDSSQEISGELLDFKITQ